VRGPWRAIHDSGDFLIVYTAARAWLHGVNPYLPHDLAATAQAAGISVTPHAFVTSPSVYLPPALPIVALFALMPWMAAKALWLACLLGLTFWSIVVFARMATKSTLPVASFLLAFAPLHAGLSKGQPSVMVCGFLFLSLFTPQPYVAGLLLGLAACIKPQLVMGFFLLAAAQQQYRKLIAACAVGMVATGIGVAFLAPGWFPALNSNLREIVGSSSGLHSGSDPTSWYQLINLHILIPDWLSGTPVEVIAYAIIVLITTIAAVRAADSSMAAALIASATVLIGYHRFYDAQVLWLGIPALLLLTPSRTSPFLWGIFAVFLVPGQTMLALWMGARPTNPGLALLLRHETIAVVLIWMILAWTAIRLRKPGCGSLPELDREAELTSLQPI
jgi:hypothetical protein